MNLKLIKLQLSCIGLLFLITLAEWLYGGIAENHLQHVAASASDGDGAATGLPKIVFPKSVSVDDNELVERPVFIEGRRPLPEANGHDGQNADNGEIEDWVLIGIYDSKDKHQTALFAKKNEAKKYLKVLIKQTISGWLLKDIQSDRVILRQADQEKTVLLRKKRTDAKPPVHNPGVPAPRPPKRPPAPVTIPHPENVNDDNQKN